MEKDRRNTLTITVRSFVPPDEPIAEFQPEEAFRMQVHEGITLDELIASFFSHATGQIGVMAVNGVLASEDTVLSSGDSIEFFPLLEGG